MYSEVTGTNVQQYLPSYRGDLDIQPWIGGPTDINLYPEISSIDSNLLQYYPPVIRLFGPQKYSPPPL